MAELYHIYIKPDAEGLQSEIESTLNLASDWFRYAPGLYIVYSSKSAKVWYARLKPFIESGGHILVLNIDPDEYQGWMPKNIWEWLKIKKNKIYGTEE